MEKNIAEDAEKNALKSFGFKINKNKKVIRGGLDHKSIPEQRNTVGPQLSS